MAIPSPWTIADIKAALERGEPDDLVRVPIAVSMSPPEDDAPGWAESICRDLAAHSDSQVRANALLGFGHLARTSGIIRKPKQVRALIEAGLADPDPVVRGQAEAAAGDLRQYMKWKLKRPGR